MEAVKKKTKFGTKVA